MVRHGRYLARRRIALWGGREIVGLILASFVAGLGTTPYAAYHFHRTAPYGVIANLLAMPVVSAEVMPMAATATASPSRSGLPPTVMHAPSRMRLCGMALRAMP
jgi:predicted membrane metal-binding protein